MRGFIGSSSHWTSTVRSPDGAVLTALRILHTESSLGWGGQELRVLDEASGMVGRGHEVTIAAAPGSRILKAALTRGLTVLEMPLAGKSVAGVLAMRRTFLECLPSVVNCHSSTDSWVCALAARIMSNPPPLVRTRHISAPIPRNLASRWLYRHATGRVVTTGESLRTQVMHETGLEGNRVDSVPTGIDLQRFSPDYKAPARVAIGLPADAFLVGIVATLRSWKGHRYLVDAIAMIDDPDVRLIVVGGGPGRDNLNEQVRALSIGGRVVFAGEQGDVVPWLRALDVFVLPSYANEGVPQAIMQAMACGVPVITTAAGAIPEIVKDDVTGVVVPVRDSGAIANAITMLRIDAERQTRFSDAGRREALLRFSSRLMLDRMETIFMEAAKRRARS